MYLDYAANTPAKDEVLKEFCSITKEYIANPNSSHPLGVKAKDKLDMGSSEIAKILKVSKESIIYTSGSSEANNLVIKGIAFQNKEVGNHIIISCFEHSSVIAPVNYLQGLGFDVSVIPLTKDGTLDLEVLKEEISDRTILVSIASVDTELGIISPLQEIVDIVKKYPNASFHTDATGAMGKLDLDYKDIDFITFSPHKFGGLGGVGVLVNTHNKKLVPLIHGGKSTTIYRSGTPPLALNYSVSTALKLAYIDLKVNLKYVKKLNEFLRNNLSKYKVIHINSPVNASPYILNFSLEGIKRDEVLKKLEDKLVFLSTGSACSFSNEPSRSVYNLTGNMDLAKNTIRISLSSTVTIKDLEKFLILFNEIIHN